MSAAKRHLDVTREPAIAALQLGARSEKDIPVTPEDRVLLDARFADFEANPGDQSPWPEVKARLKQRQR